LASFAGKAAPPLPAHLAQVVCDPSLYTAVSSMAVNLRHNDYEKPGAANHNEQVNNCFKRVDVHRCTLQRVIEQGSGHHDFVENTSVKAEGIWLGLPIAVKLAHSS
jgi:hypothetical protein